MMQQNPACKERARATAFDYIPLENTAKKCPETRQNLFADTPTQPSGLPMYLRGFAAFHRRIRIIENTPQNGRERQSVVTAHRHNPTGAATNAEEESPSHGVEAPVRNCLDRPSCVAYSGVQQRFRPGIAYHPTGRDLPAIEMVAAWIGYWANSAATFGFLDLLLSDPQVAAGFFGGAVS